MTTQRLLTVSAIRPRSNGSFLDFAAVLLLAVLWSASGNAQTVTLNPLWSLATDAGLDFIGTAANERGAAINPVNGHVIVVSRTGGLNLVVLDSATGAEISRLDTTDVAGGTFALSAVGVADDGVIYAANLTVGATEAAPFKIYRWADESAVPTVAYAGPPSVGFRFGDSLDVRGAGATTQIAAGAGAVAAGQADTGTRFAIFTTADGQTFTARGFAPAGVSAGNMAKGIAFGEGNTVFGKVNGFPARHCSFDLGAGTARLERSLAIENNISPVSVDPVNKLLAGINYAAHQVLVYDISDLASPMQLSSAAMPLPATANANGVGAIDFSKNKLIALDTQNGARLFGITIDTNPVAPVISQQPVGGTPLEGAQLALSVGASGTRPFSYQWYFNGTNLIENATNNTLTLRSLRPVDSGSYSVRVSNAVGGVESAAATVTVVPLVKSGRLAALWSLAPGSRTYITDDNTQRGVAYNPVSDSVLLVSRAGGVNVWVLNARTGAEKGKLRTTGEDGANFIIGGTFTLNMIGVAEDGAIYACNLTTDGNNFTIYRWADDSPETVPTLAFGPENSGIARVGDTFDVRGRGPNTQILAGSNTGKTALVLTTADGTTFTPNVVTVDAAAAGNFRLGIAFGPGDTFFGKAVGATTPLQWVGYDLATGVGTVRSTIAVTQFASAIGPIGYDPVNRLLAGVSIETPDNLRLYDASDLSVAPALVHQELFAADNANINGTGAIDFGPNFLVALDSNNGLVAYRVQAGSMDPPVLAVGLAQGRVNLTWEGLATLQMADAVTGPYVDLPGATSPQVVDPVLAPQRFYRLRR